MPKIIEEQCGVPEPSDGGNVEADVIELLGVAPAFALALTYLTAAQSTGVLFENAVARSQQQNIIAQTALNQAVLQMFSVGTTAAANSVAHMEHSEDEQTTQSLIPTLQRYFSR